MSITAVPQAVNWMQNVHSTLQGIPYGEQVLDLAVKRFQLIQNIALIACGGKELSWDLIHTKPSTPERHYSVYHGTMYSLSGIIGIAALILNSPELAEAGLIVFTISNLYALKYNVDVFMASSAAKTRVSAAYGIVSNLAYILSTLLTATDFHTALAIFFGCVGLFAGSAKIILDALITANYL